MLLQAFLQLNMTYSITVSTFTLLEKNFPPLKAKSSILKSRNYI